MVTELQVKIAEVKEIIARLNDELEKENAKRKKLWSLHCDQLCNQLCNITQSHSLRKGYENYWSQ